MKKHYLLFFMLSFCSVLPSGYSEYLIGTWISTENIATPTGVKQIIYTSVYKEDHILTIKIQHPLLGTSTQTYKYQVGFYNPKPAIIQYDIATEEVVGVPIFYYFANEFNTLVTSTNANMLLSRQWNK